MPYLSQTNIARFPIMFVYGIRCSPCDLLGLPAGAVADYYIDYGLLVFPTYTCPAFVRAYGALTPAFWNRVRKVVSGTVHVVDREHPWITEEEDSVVRALRDRYPTLQTEWFFVPHSKLVSESDPVISDDEE